MAKEKENVLQAGGAAPAADIPDLKKKDKERKRAGAAWSGVRGVGGEFTGATGGAVARAAASAAGLAAEATIVEGVGVWATLARFAGTLLGKAAITAAVLLVMAGGIVSYLRLKAMNTVGVAEMDFGAIADSMHVRAGGADRLGVDSKGEVRFEGPKAAKKPAPTAPAKAPEPAPAPVEAKVETPPFVPSDTLAHNLSGAKLSASIGGSFGSKNIFAGNKAIPLLGANLLKVNGTKGQAAAIRPSTIHATASAMNTNKGFANKAFGQLRLAKGLSLQGAGANGPETASSLAQNAFDQQQTLGGGLATINAPGGDSPAPSNPGAPDVSMPPTPDSPGAGADPQYQSEQEQIDALANEASANLKEGTILVAIGLMLIAIGSWVIGIPGYGALGAMLIAMGTALLAAGTMLIMESKAEEAQALAMGNSLQNQFGDTQTGTINSCTTNTVQNGSTVSSCAPTAADTSATASDPSQLQQACVGNGLISVNGTCVQSGAGTAGINAN